MIEHAVKTWLGGGSFVSRSTNAAAIEELQYDNALDQLTGIVDALGNTTSIAHNARGQPVSIASITGVASFVYDGYNRRQSATRSGTSTSFLYAFWDIAQEQQSDNPSADLLLGTGLDERLSRANLTFLTDIHA